MKYIIVDIDGTVAHSHTRQRRILEMLKGTPVAEMPWEKLFHDCDKDEPIEPIVNLIQTLSCHYHIVFCTSRNIAFREKTRIWIDKYTGLWKAPLLMRKSPNDHRSDIIVKPELLKEAGITTANTAFILEDKITTVEAWRALGFTVLQPINNEY